MKTECESEKVEESNLWSAREKKNKTTLKQLNKTVASRRAQFRTHPCSQTAVILVVTVRLLKARARAVVFLLHEPVVDSFPCQTGIDYKTVA